MSTRGAKVVGQMFEAPHYAVDVSPKMNRGGVGVFLPIDRETTLVLRLGAPAELDALVEDLLAHREKVWPGSPKT